MYKCFKNLILKEKAKNDHLNRNIYKPLINLFGNQLKKVGIMLNEGRPLAKLFSSKGHQVY